MTIIIISDIIIIIVITIIIINIIIIRFLKKFKKVKLCLDGKL